MTFAWKTSKRVITINRPIVMGIVNVTPDSFSDGGHLSTAEDGVRRAMDLVASGAAVVDVGGESTRPGSERVAPREEIRRVLPVIERLSEQAGAAISIDTTKYEVAEVALDAGAEIINDISGLRWEPRLAELAARSGAGLILMHSRGDFETMHSQPPVDEIVDEVIETLRMSVTIAVESGVGHGQIAIDPGIGFSKAFEQNLELLGKLDKIVAAFERYPVLVGTSRKSFIGRALGGAPVGERLAGSVATAVYAAMKGAAIPRVHDVRETVEALRLVSAIETAQ